MAEIDDDGMFSGESLGLDHAHHGMEVRSSRSFEHAGHAVEIRATYVVLVDGEERQLHFSVGQDGKVTTHLRPYFTYGSLVDMVKDVLDHFPERFGEGEAPAPHGGGHGDHGEGE